MSSPQTAPSHAEQTSSSVVASANPATYAEPSPAPATPMITAAAIVKPKGYGLPCLKCHTYYGADMAACPVCKSAERVLPLEVIRPAASPRSEQLPDPETIEKERERFLEELQLNVAGSPVRESLSPAVLCNRDENHQTASAVATVCQGCYHSLEQRVDVLEAVLHMDVKEAAEVIYEAVWSDPSDPSKTYINAAQALLGELRRRAGVTPSFGALQPLAH